MQYGAYSVFNNAQFAYDNQIPWYFTDDEDLPTKAEIINKYWDAALKAMEIELDEAAKKLTTEDDVKNWALEIAQETGLLFLRIKHGKN